MVACSWPNRLLKYSLLGLWMGDKISHYSVMD